MPTTDTQPSLDHPPRRRWHASTWVFMAIVAFLLLLGNYSGRHVRAPDIYGDGKYGPDFGVATLGEHGWPWTYLWRDWVYHRSSQGNWRLSWWRINEGVQQFRLAPLLGNIAFAMAILVVAPMLYESWRRRRQRIFQFGIRDLLGFMTLIGIVMGYYAVRRASYEHELAILRQLDAVEIPGTTFADSDHGAEWDYGVLASLQTDDDPYFPRVNGQLIGIHAHGAHLEHLVGLRNLRTLDVSPGVTARQLELLEQFDRLEALVLRFGFLENEDMSELEQSGEDDDSLLPLPRLPNLRGLNLTQASFRGDGLEHLKQIEVLHLTGTEVDDDALAKLAGLRHLKILSLADTEVTGAGLRHLAGLTSLEELWLWGTPTGDEGVRHLASLPNLRRLHLGYDVTDASVPLLKQFTRLEYLSLESEVTEDGVKQLQAALPNCVIVW
jgi:hypothetical protein